MYLNQKGDAEKAIECCKKALEVGMSNSWLVARSLGIMEEAFAKVGKGEKFISYCRELKEKKVGELQGLKLTQWYLEPKELSGLFTQTVFTDEFDQPTLKSAWEWINPRRESSYSLSSEVSWLEVRAASGINLYMTLFDVDTPRFMQEISGDFAVEVKMKTASDEVPSIGGLLIWKNKENYLRFERGMDRKDEISLSGVIGGEFAYFGRGMLAADILYLRLERIGDSVSAYCSKDEAMWLTCGEVNFPAEDPIQAGIHVIGGAVRGGWMATATRFDDFKIFR
jgi:regulation of enolase protein 1 (concanavalin A-like superfamily)